MLDELFWIGLLLVFYAVMAGLAILAGVPLWVASLALAGLYLIVLVEALLFLRSHK